MELIEAKDYFPAVELLREAVRFAPDKAEYRFRLGEVELRNSKWIDRGLENLKEAARLAPSRTDFLRATARALLSHGRKHEAEPYARRANDLEPGTESAALLHDVIGRRTLEREARQLHESHRPGGFLSRLLRRGR
jgi:tetratricopeptide (TPR) repeat protein